jgi:hypothetical protein
MALVSLFLSGLLAGCASFGDDGEGGLGGGDGGDDSAAGGGDSGGEDGGEGGGGGGGQDDPIAGVYQVRSAMDLTSTSLANDLVPDVVAILNQLTTTPADTLIGLLESANVPILDQLLGLLGEVLLDPFRNFVDEYVINRVVEGIPLTQQLSALTSEITALLTQFEIVSELELSGLDASGQLTSATHRLSALSLPLLGQQVLVDTPALVDQITAADGVSCSVSLSEGEGELQVGDHAFGLPLGDFALDALDRVLGGGDGAGLRDRLGALVDCAAMADEVSSRCLGPLCVGNRDEIEQFCEAGLDQAVSQIEARVASINFAEIRFQAGDALLRDSDSDGQSDGLIDLLEQGNWQTVVFVKGIELPFAAAFDGLRVAPVDSGD